MNLDQIYKIFPDQKDCIAHLEKVRWPDSPSCPYCKSVRFTKTKNEMRYHCNTCNTSYSVKVGSLFENSKLDLQKWFLAICLLASTRRSISSRNLALKIDVTKDTAWSMKKRISKAVSEYNSFFSRLIVMTEKAVTNC